MRRRPWPISHAAGRQRPDAAVGRRRVGGVLAAGRQAKWERERKFRTTWDAIAWLNKQHPEIDLDKPYKPRK